MLVVKCYITKAIISYGYLIRHRPAVSGGDDDSNQENGDDVRDNTDALHNPW